MVTKAITLWQPWASLVALGVKRIETRSWPAPPALIGQRIAVHAAARKVRYVSFGSDRDSWHVAPDGWGEYGDRSPVLWRDTTPPDALFAQQIRRPLPLGAVLGSFTLAACVPMTNWPHARACGPEEWLFVGHPSGDLTEMYGLVGGQIVKCEDQRPYGDFQPGRWAWFLEDICASTDRCPAGCDGGYLSVVRGDSLGGRAGKQPCTTCHGAGSCPPIPAKGGQRIWNWTP